MFTYEQLTGKLHDSSDAVIGIGYSGYAQDKNNPASEGKEDKGPIPCGIYKIIGPPINTTTHGPYVLRLIPDQATKERIIALGRNPLSFLIHGDNVHTPGAASEGCIIQSRGVREQVWAANATDPDLQVISGIINPDTDGEISV